MLPGTYHNFISAQRAFLNLSDRGFAAIAKSLDWGPRGEVQTIQSGELQTRSLELFGYEYTAPEIQWVRDIFKGARTLYLYNPVLAGSAAASNTYATAKSHGTRGNNISILVSNNADNVGTFNVSTLVGTAVVDTQTAVSSAADLVENAYVTWKVAATLTAGAGLPLTGGVNGTGGDDAAAHQMALDAFESFGFNTLICDSNVEGIKSLYAAYVRRIREEVGGKFQVVMYNGLATDYEGVINILNASTDATVPHALVYWVGGVSAGVNVNASNTNRIYDGEYGVDMTQARTQQQLISAIRAGQYTFHQVDNTVRVLTDINSYTSFTSEKNEDFSSNQLVRVIDQIAIDTANIFNTRYLGRVPNDNDGRISLWNDILTHRLELQRLRAIQAYDTRQLTVGPGTARNAVLVNEVVTITYAMEKLYITTTVA